MTVARRMTPDDRRDALVLLAILVLAALLRLPGIDARGTWEDDQGQQVLAVQQWLATGTMPLLGPPSSIGDVHHGVVTYWLFLPAAALSGGDPTGVVVLLTLLGLVGVAATWGLARTIGGPVAGHAAGVLGALSPTWIEASTFVWNANLVGPAAAVALLGTWRAWETGRVRWWLAAGAGSIVLVHAHLLGTLLVPPLAFVAFLDWRRRAGQGRRRFLAAAGVVGIAFAATLVPLAIHEATTGFAETRALADWAAGRLAGTAPDAFAADPLVVRLGIVAWRAVSWPVTGLVVDAPVASALVTVVVAVLLGWRAAAATGPERWFVRWAIGALAFVVGGLAVLAPSLARVVRELPNDHYHAYVDPLVITVLALAVAAWWRAAGSWPGAIGNALPPAAGSWPGALGNLLPPASTRGGRAAWRPGQAVAVAVVGATVGLGVGAIPPVVSPDGGWPAARAAAARAYAAVEAGGGGSVAVVPAASFKTGHSVTLPLVLLGADVADGSLGEGMDEAVLRATVAGADALVLVCDPVFADVIGLACGGPAEEARLATVGAGGGEAEGSGAWELAERFEAGPRRTLSVYLRAGER